MLVSSKGPGKPDSPEEDMRIAKAFCILLVMAFCYTRTRGWLW